MAKRWSPEDDVMLSRLYRSGEGLAQIGRRLGRSPSSVDERRRLLAIPARRPLRAWTEQEDRFLLGLAEAGFPATVAADRLRRSDDQVRRRLRHLRGSPAAQHRPYSDAEDRLIRSAFRDGADLVTLADRLGRTVSSVRARGARLGVHEPDQRSRWAPEEDEVVRRGYGRGASCDAIAAELGTRSSRSVVSRAAKLGIATYARRWRPIDDGRLRELLADGTLVETIAVELGRTPESLRQRARRLNIDWPRQADRPQHRRPWTEADERLLRQYAELNPAVLARMLDRTPSAVIQRRRRLGGRGGGHSPHHPVPDGQGELTPAQMAVVERELPGAGARRAMAVAGRLGVRVSDVWKPESARPEAGRPSPAARSR